MTVRLTSAPKAPEHLSLQNNITLCRGYKKKRNIEFHTRKRKKEPDLLRLVSFLKLFRSLNIMIFLLYAIFATKVPFLIILRGQALNPYVFIRPRKIMHNRGASSSACASVWVRPLQTHLSMT